MVSVLSWGIAMARSERTIRAAFNKNNRKNSDGDDSDVIDI
ncbi:MAG: hypothetical protein ACLUKN_04185 [Bacilli bacterium]